MTPVDEDQGTVVWKQVPMLNSGNRTEMRGHDRAIAARKRYADENRRSLSNRGVVYLGASADILWSCQSHAVQSKIW